MTPEEQRMMELKAAQLEAQRRAEIDRTTGAPAGVRAMVGSARSPEDRLLNLRTYYPDAEPFEGDNFVYTDPKSGRRTLYNEDNPTVMGLPIPTGGDIASLRPEITQAVTGTLAGIAATPPALAAAIPTGGQSLWAIPTAVGLGASGGQELLDMYDYFMGNRIDTRKLPERLVDAATVFGENAIGQRVGDIATNAPKVAGQFLRNTMSGGVEEAAKNADVLARSGIDPIVPLVTGDKAVSGAYNTLAKLPTSSGTVGKQIKTALDQARDRMSQITERYGSTRTQERAGQIAKKGAIEGAERFAKRGGELYDELDKFISPDELVETPATLGALEEYINEFGINKKILAMLEPGDFARWRNALDPTTNEEPITYGMIKALRTKLRQRLMTRGVYPQEDMLTYEALYNGLSVDMKTMAKEYGGDAGLAAWKRANTYWRNFRNLTKEHLDPLTNKDAMPSKIFDEAMRGSKDGAMRLRKLKATLSETEWNELASYKLRELGMPNAADRAAMGAEEAALAQEFSPLVFFREWQKLDRRAKDALFGGAKSELRMALDDLVKSSKMFQEASKTVNYSNTGLANFWNDALTMRNLVSNPLSLTSGGYAAGEVGGAILAGSLSTMSPWASAKLMTSPRFVRWLTTAQRIDPRNIAKTRSHIGRLASIAFYDSTMAEPVAAYMSSLEELLGGQQ